MTLWGIRTNKKRGHMKKSRLIRLLLFTALCFFVYSFVCTQSVQSQTVNDDGNYEEINSYNGMINSFLDPVYPKMKRTNDKYSNEVDYKRAMKSYALIHEAFPHYINTGDKASDMASYESAKNKWFEDNPYFPQLIDKGHPEQDKECFEKARREWINRYPEKYHTLYELVTGDDELMREYSFIIQK
jgi:hypothetical protein